MKNRLVLAILTVCFGCLTILTTSGEAYHPQSGALTTAQDRWHTATGDLSNAIINLVHLDGKAGDIDVRIDVNNEELRDALLSTPQHYSVDFINAWASALSAAALTGYDIYDGILLYQAMQKAAGAVNTQIDSIGTENDSPTASSYFAKRKKAYNDYVREINIHNAGHSGDDIGLPTQSEATHNIARRTPPKFRCKGGSPCEVEFDTLGEARTSHRQSCPDKIEQDLTDEGVDCPGFLWTCNNRPCDYENNGHIYQCYGGCSYHAQSRDNAEKHHRTTCEWDANHKYYRCNDDQVYHHTKPERSYNYCSHRHAPCQAQYHIQTQCDDSNCISRNYRPCQGTHTHVYSPTNTEGTTNNQQSNNNVVAPPPETVVTPTPPQTVTCAGCNQSYDPNNRGNHYQMGSCDLTHNGENCTDSNMWVCQHIHTFATPNFAYAWNDPCGHRLTIATLSGHNWVQCNQRHPTDANARCESGGYYECQTHTHTWVGRGSCHLHTYDPTVAGAKTPHMLHQGQCTHTNMSGQRCTGRDFHPCKHTHTY